MTSVVVLLFILMFIAAVLWRLVHSQAHAITRLEDLPGRTRAIDMASFQNLIEPSETLFLRQSLTPPQFRTVQRERCLAATVYVRNIAHNAGVLIQLGQMAQLNPDPQLAEAARVMVDRAAHVRIMATLVLMKLYVRSVVPAMPFAPEGIFGDYRNLTEAAILFTRLQRPAFAGRVTAML
jgi:hypothetical protein